LVENLVNLVKRKSLDLRPNSAGASQFQNFFKISVRTPVAMTTTKPITTTIAKNLTIPIMSTESTRTTTWASAAAVNGDPNRLGHWHFDSPFDRAALAAICDFSEEFASTVASFINSGWNHLPQAARPPPALV
jgi:hypothetical protein